MWCDIHHVINCTWQFRMSQIIQLLHRMSVRMENTRIFIYHNFVNFFFDWLNELRMLNWGISRNLFLSLRGWIDVNSDNVLNPLLEFWHFLSWKLISTSWYMNAVIIIQNKLCILESPSISFEPLLFVFDIFRSLYVLLFKNSLQLIESLHSD